MIDVKLTSSGLWPPTCLYEWVDGVQEWSFSCLVSCLRIAGASSVYQLESQIRLWLGCSSLHYYVVEILPICRVLEISFGDVCYISVATVEEFYIAFFFSFIGDVTSISWIFILFACFIALIKIWCYRKNFS